MKTITAAFIALLLIPMLAFGQQQTPVTILPVGYGGTLIYRNIDLDEADQQVSGTPANLYGWYLFNASNATRYFKFWNALAANVTVGTTVDTLVLTIPVPAGGGTNVFFTDGIEFRTGITVACLTGIADTNTGAPSANDCVANMFFKN